MLNKSKRLNKAIFIQKNSWTRFNYIGSQNYQKITLFLGYLVFFAVNYITITLISKGVNYWTNNSGINQINSKNAIALVAVYFFHTSVAWYYLWKAFSSFYTDHDNWKRYLIWFVIYLIHAGLFIGLIFYFERIIYRFHFKPNDWLWFRYYVLIFIYILLIEAFNNLYLIRYHRQVATVEVNLYKIKFFGLILLIFYLFAGWLLTLGSLEEIKTRFIWLFHTVYYYSFWGITRTVVVLSLIITPLIIHSIYTQKNKYKKIHNPMIALLSTRLSFVVLSSNIVYYLNNIKVVFHGPIDGPNYLYLGLSIFTIIIVWAATIWNSVKLNSSAYYFLIVSFGWLVLAWLMIMIFLSYDYFNIYSKLNSVILSIGSLLIFGTITFNYYQMNKLQMITFNLSTTLIGLLLISIAFLINAGIGVSNQKANVYLFMYLSIGAVIFLNFNVFLFGFIRSIQRLKKQSQSKWQRRKRAKYEQKQAKLTEIYYG